jgi:hypothetical protein
MKLVIEVPVTESGSKFLKAMDEKFILNQVKTKLLEQLKSNPVASFIDKEKMTCKFEP